MPSNHFDECKIFLARLNRDCTWTHDSAIEIVEKSAGGRGKISFDVSSPCLAFQSLDDQPPIRWLQERKCADGAFILFNQGEAHLHIVELKSGLKLKEWEKARSQFRGMLLSAIAIKSLIGLSHFNSVTCYLAYSRDLLQPANDAAPVLRKFKLGTDRALADIGDWLGGYVDIEPGVRVELKKISRDANGNARYSLI